MSVGNSSYNRQAHRRKTREREAWENPELLELHDHQAEEAALAAAVTNQAACAYLVEHCCEEDFWSADKRSVLRAVTKLHTAGRPVDSVTVRTAVGSGVKPEDATRLSDYVAHLSESFVVAANVSEYVASIVAHRTKRRVVQAAAAIQEAALSTNDNVADLPSCLEAIMAAAVGEMREVAGLGYVQAASTARIIRMCDVEAQAISWLWPSRVPLGKYTLLIGDPGLLKSTLSLYMAAKVTTGGAWPDDTSKACDGCAPLGDVVLLTAEDGLADTVRPRLDDLGANVERVWALRAVYEEGKDGERIFNLLGDIAVLERVVVEKQAVLVIIDPVNAYIAGTDSHNAAEVRQVLSPVSAMAERTGAAVVCIHHLNKGDGSVNALYRASGSLDFVAAARSVLGVATDPVDKERVLLLPVKLNIAAKPEGIGYHRGDTGLVFDGRPVNIDANEAFGARKARAESPQMAEAKKLLTHLLDGGEPVAARLIMEEAEAQSIVIETLRRAKTKLGVRAVQRFDAAAGKSAWYWYLEAGQ